MGGFFFFVCLAVYLLYLFIVGFDDKQIYSRLIWEVYIYLFIHLSALMFVFRHIKQNIK